LHNKTINNKKIPSSFEENFNTNKVISAKYNLKNPVVAWDTQSVQANDKR